MFYFNGTKLLHQKVFGGNMDYNFTADKPIYLQIMDVFRTSIVSGELKPGDRVASVRDLALQAKVNPNTMQKALSELEREGLVVSERTTGRFITGDNKLIETLKKDLVKTEMDAFLEKMESLNISTEFILQYLEEKTGIRTTEGEINNDIYAK